MTSRGKEPLRQRTRGFYPDMVDGETAASITPLSAIEALDALEVEYPPKPWEPRYDPVTELVFTILSQHTSDRNSERAFVRLMKTFTSLEAVANGDTELITQCINIGGLARVKAPRIKQVLNMILELNGSFDLSFLQEMPIEEAKGWLRQLPGIGPKSAAIVLCFSLGIPAMAVDTHIYRVAKRLGLIDHKATVEQAHDLLEGVVKPHQVYPLHMALITHGRRVCKAPKPLCSQCVLSYICPSRNLPL
jgi:endonuclease-3